MTAQLIFFSLCEIVFAQEELLIYCIFSNILIMKLFLALCMPYCLLWQRTFLQTCINEKKLKVSKYIPLNQ